MTAAKASPHAGRRRELLALGAIVAALLAGPALALWQPTPQRAFGVVAALSSAAVAFELRPRRTTSRLR